MNGLWSLVLGLQDTAWHQACLATACCSCMQRCLPGLEMVPRQSCEWSFSSKVSGLGLGSWFKFQNDWSKSVPETVPERKPEPVSEHTKNWGKIAFFGLENWKMFSSSGILWNSSQTTKNHCFTGTHLCLGCPVFSLLGQTLATCSKSGGETRHCSSSMASAPVTDPLTLSEMLQLQLPNHAPHCVNARFGLPQDRPEICLGLPPRDLASLLFLDDLPKLLHLLFGRCFLLKMGFGPIHFGLSKLRGSLWPFFGQGQALC